MTEEQIERVARAIAECDRPSSISIATWWHLRGEDFTEKARAAIAAMPTASVQSDERLREIADFLIDQQFEPWPGEEHVRTHYWRSKAIKAANDLIALTKPEAGSAGE